MNSIKTALETEAWAKGRPKADSMGNARLGLAGRIALRRVFRVLCFFVGYLFVVEVLDEIFKWSRLTASLLQFIPYCLVLARVAYCGRALAQGDKQTLLMVSCLACVFIALGFDVTKNLPSLNAMPILGRDSPWRNDISSMAILVALASFPAAGYFLIQEIFQVKRQLDEHVEQLEEALRHVQRLQGLLPVCMYCHKIRTDQQSWQQIEAYITEHSEAKFTHSMCPECTKQHFPELQL